jgi:flagellar L-ring protein precursor FlgH
MTNKWALAGGAGLVLFCAMGITSVVLGQTTSAPPAQAYTTSPAAAEPGPGGSSEARLQVPLGALVQRSGGSLARAQMVNESNATSASTSSVSYYSVSEQKPKLLRKHDLLTIVVREDSQFSSDGTTDLKHNADLDAIIDSYVGLGLSHGITLNENTPTTPLELKTSGQRDFKGDAQVNRTDSFSASITAEVVDVKPNGTLVIQAHKAIKTDEEEQDFKLTGTCRVEDVTADNTVLSTQLYDLNLNKVHKGAVRDTTKRGWIPRLLDVLNPF